MAGNPITGIGSAVLQAPVSGLYERRELGLGPGPGPTNTLAPTIVESLRLDVDGWYPQMMASGSFASGGLTLFGGFVEWAATVEETPLGLWEGPIIGVWGDKDLLPQRNVRIQAPDRGRLTVLPARLIVTFYGGAPDVTRTLQYASAYFRTAEIEWDTVEQATRVTSFNTGSHPNRPASLPIETLTIPETFSRLGVDLQISPEEHIVPLSRSDSPADPVHPDDKWSDSELEDVMKVYWTRYKSQAQWAIWFLFAGLHENPDYRGIMFDHFGAYKRRGGAVFNDWWLDKVGEGDDHRDAQIRRRRFVTACHETGHCFDLIHSWETPASGWWPLGGEPFARSFMNNPEQSGGVEDFFSQFQYRFSDREIAFVRHAPEKFVEMGGPYYGDSFSDAALPLFPTWTLEASVSRSQRVFDFLEPVMLDVRLTNNADQPQVIDENILRHGDNLKLYVGRAGGMITELRPYAIACLAPRWRVLQPGESIVQSVFASAGARGWLISEPGPYELRVRLSTATAQAISRSLPLRVATPCGRDEEVIAQDFFTDEVGRALALGGTAVMQQANTVLERIANEMGGNPAARHAQLALGLPKLKWRKVLRLKQGEAPFGSAAADGGTFALTRPEPEDARRLITAALRPGPGRDTFAGEYLERMAARFSGWLRREAGTAEAD